MKKPKPRTKLSGGQAGGAPPGISSLGAPRRTWLPGKGRGGDRDQGWPHPRMYLRAEAGGGQPFNPKHWPGRRPVPCSRPGSGPGLPEGLSVATRTPLCPGAGTSAGAHGPDLATASGGGEGPLQPAPALPPGPGPAGRSRGVRSGPGSRGDGEGHRPQEAPSRGGDVRATFGLAVGAVLVVLLPQQLGQDELVLLIQLLSLLPAGARRHL